MNEPAAEFVRMAWRTGRSIGRTVYAVPPGAQYRDGSEAVLGMLDTPDLAAHVVKVHNQWLYDGAQMTTDSVRPWWEYDPNWKPGDDPPVFEPWPDNLPLEAQVERLGAVLLEHYQQTFDRSEGAMEKAARLLWERAQSDGPEIDQ